MDAVWAMVFCVRTLVYLHKDRIPQPRKQWEDLPENAGEHHYAEQGYGQNETTPLEPAHTESVAENYSAPQNSNLYNYGVTLNMHEEEEE